MKTQPKKRLNPTACGQGGRVEAFGTAYGFFGSDGGVRRHFMT